MERGTCGFLVKCGVRTSKRERERMAHTRRQRSLHTGVIHTVSIGVFAPYDNSLRNADRSASTKYTITVCSRYERIVVVGKEKKIGGVFRLFAAFNSAHFSPSYRFRYRPPLSSPCLFIFHPVSLLYTYIHTYIYIYMYRKKSKGKAEQSQESRLLLVVVVLRARRQRKY